MEKANAVLAGLPLIKRGTVAEPSIKVATWDLVRCSIALNHVLNWSMQKGSPQEVRRLREHCERKVPLEKNIDGAFIQVPCSWVRYNCNLDKLEMLVGMWTKPTRARREASSLWPSREATLLPTPPARHIRWSLSLAIETTPHGLRRKRQLGRKGTNGNRALFPQMPDLFQWFRIHSISA